MVSFLLLFFLLLILAISWPKINERFSFLNCHVILNYLQKIVPK
jgi:hypothetical protein